jgi:multiple sugar transport system permease protein
MSRKARDARRLATGLAFIGPNVVGFLIFTLFPLVFSLVMAFTNWDLRLHNTFREGEMRFLGWENFSRLFQERYFSVYLGNKLFLMLGIPLSVAASLVSALLLSRDLGRSAGARVRVGILATVLLVAGVGALLLANCGGTAAVIVIGGVALLILTAGAAGGTTVYRTLFYFPHFTAGVATYLLWKKIYSPYTGPVNHVLRPPLAALARTVTAVPAWTVQAGLWVCAALALVLVGLSAWRLRRLWRDGEAGWVAVLLGLVLLALPAGFWPLWSVSAPTGYGVAAATALILAVAMVSGRRREFVCPADFGIGPVLITCGAVMAVQFALIGLGDVCFNLPAMSADGLEPPHWLDRYEWAKPSIMVMGFWASIGSNNMLLYLAGLSNIPPELYEAADIDGASSTQRFWAVTWPQLAPVTFFIMIMSVIGGLQGGFEMARTMTQGGPARATTTLSYYVYTEGFETGHLGYASAIAWALFGLVFAVTLFNWKFGNRYTNE